jgi:hypothetical protein
MKLFSFSAQGVNPAVGSANGTDESLHGSVSEISIASRSSQQDEPVANGDVPKGSEQPEQPVQKPDEPVASPTIDGDRSSHGTGTILRLTIWF